MNNSFDVEIEKFRKYEITENFVGKDCLIVAIELEVKMEVMI